MYVHRGLAEIRILYLFAIKTQYKTSNLRYGEETSRNHRDYLKMTLGGDEIVYYSVGAVSELRRWWTSVNLKALAKKRKVLSVSAARDAFWFPNTSVVAAADLTSSCFSPVSDRIWRGSVPILVSLDIFSKQASIASKQISQKKERRLLYWLQTNTQVRRLNGLCCLLPVTVVRTGVAR